MTDENKNCGDIPAVVDCAPEKPSQYDLVLKQYADTLDITIQGADASLKTKSIEAATKSESVCTERKGSEKLYRALKEYYFLSNCISVYAGQDIEGLQVTVAEDVTKYTAMKKSFDDAVAAIKIAKQKIGQVNTLACKLKDAVPDSCNSEEKKLIKECLGKGPNKQKGLEESVAEIVAHANHINNKIDDVAQSAVKVAGINGFINISSLVALATAVKTTGTAFIGNVEANVKSLQTDYEASRVSLGDALKLLSTATTEKYKAWSVKEGLNATGTFVKENNCTGDCGSLDDLSAQAEDSFNSSHCDDDEPNEEE